MILGTWIDRRRYLPMHPLLAPGFSFVDACRACFPSPGTYALRGDDLLALVQCYQTQPEMCTGWEGHRKYVDVHCILQGCETQLWAPKPPDIAGEYDREYDVFHCMPQPWCPVKVGPEQFTIFFPEDLHKAKCVADSPQTIRKVILKLALEAMPCQGVPLEEIP